MICGNETAERYRDQLEAAAHVHTTGVRVVIVHPKFRTACPEYRNGTVRLPACLFGDPGFPELWERSWRHELQHAVDDQNGWLGHFTRDEAEARARKAETAEPRKSFHE